MNKIKTVILLPLLFILFAVPFYKTFASQPSNKENLIIFWQIGCPHCAKVEKFIKDNSLSDYFNIEMKEIRYNNENRKEFLKTCSKYGIPLEEEGVPLALIRGKCLIGDRQIISSLKELSLNSGGSFSNNAAKNKNKPIAQENKLTFPLVAGAAAVDAINPCAFAVLIMLMTTILAAGNRKRALLSGISFSVAIFIAYFLMGLGIYKALAVINFSEWFIKFVGGLAIFIGLLNIKDYFWYGGGGFIMEVPRKWRPKMKSIIKSATSPVGSAAIGLIVSSFLLPCTSGPYLVILGMLSQKAKIISAISWLLFYNLIFILPMLLISFVVYKGMEPGKLEKTREKNLKFLHLAAGIIMLAMGIFIIFNF